MCSTMSSTSLTIEQRLDRLYARSQANGSTTSPDPHSGILDWRPSSMTKPAAKTSSSPPPPLLKKARHRPRSEDSVPKVDEAAIAKLKRVDDDQVSKIFAEMNDIGGGAALSPVVRHSGCARLREFVPSLQKTSFEQAQEIAASSRRRLDDHDSDSSGLEETDDDDDKTPQARSVGGAVCALLPEERPVKTSPSAASSPLLRKASTVPMDITADDDDASRLSGRVQITAQERRSSSERGRRQRSRSPARSRKSSPPDRRKGEADLPPAPPRLRVSAEAKVACSPSASVAPVSASSPSLGSSMESPTVGQSNQTVLVQQSVKWKDAVKLKRLADKMKKEAPLSEGWCKRQEMYMSAGLKFLEAAEMYSCAYSYQNTAQYFENIIQMYLSAGCHFFTCIGYECSAVALYRAMQVRRKDFSIQVNQLLAHVRAHQSKNTAAAATDSAPEPLSFPSKLGDMLSSYLRHSKCAWDYMDDWDKAKAYRPSREVLDAHRLEVLESLDNLDMAKFIDHVRRALSSSFTS